jgi:hypothetical protein
MSAKNPAKPTGPDEYLRAAALSGKTVGAEDRHAVVTQTEAGQNVPGPFHPWNPEAFSASFRYDCGKPQILEFRLKRREDVRAADGGPFNYDMKRAVAGRPPDGRSGTAPALWVRIPSPCSFSLQAPALPDDAGEITEDFSERLQFYAGNLSKRRRRRKIFSRRRFLSKDKFKWRLFLR